MIKRIALKLLRFLRYSEKQEVARRYFFLSAFDGALAAFGIVAGASLVNDVSPAFVVAAGIGASLAMLVSGVAGAYITEEAESRRRIKELEEAMLVDMRESEVVDVSIKGAVVAALINGLAAFMTAVIVLTPYILAVFNPSFAAYAMHVTFATALSVLFLLGMALAKISGQNIIIMATKMTALGVITILVIMLLNML
ncbi:MAG TPA: hypothetical protein EYH45_07270 [Candidatus Caldiarchaeum subterraneum]|uniref:TIGR00267 family protein n=1 Tax=Caldiarchaeum subterraneum TaxID=311458 RepID=A0A832ZZQ6_CALS0|nr:hypothetical protein [Aigarchaeota archaeon]HIQ30346.1 hypothetical protein [Candidatus Caldarchaeum subterraneum]